MKQVHVLSGTKYEQAALVPVRELLDECNARLKDEEVELVHFCLDDVEIVFDGDNVRVSAGDTDLIKSDLIVFRGPVSKFFRTAYMLAVIFDHLGVPFINRSVLNYRGVDKASQHANIFKLGLPIPKTYYAEPSVFFRNVEQHFEYPFIVKDFLASHGANNFLVRDKDQLDKISNDPALEGREFIAQTMIENDGDYRVLILGENQLVIHRKGDGSSHLNNTSAGGEGVVVSPDVLPPGVMDMSIKLADAFGFSMTGVDVIVDKHTGKAYFLEANSQPQISDGAVTDKKIDLFVEMIRSQLT